MDESKICASEPNPRSATSAIGAAEVASSSQFTTRTTAKETSMYKIPDITTDRIIALGSVFLGFLPPLLYLPCPQIHWWQQCKCNGHAATAISGCQIPESVRCFQGVPEGIATARASKARVHSDKRSG